MGGGGHYTSHLNGTLNKLYRSARECLTGASTGRVTAHERSGPYWRARCVSISPGPLFHWHSLHPDLAVQDLTHLANVSHCCHINVIDACKYPTNFKTQILTMTHWITLYLERELCGKLHTERLLCGIHSSRTFRCVPRQWNAF